VSAPEMRDRTAPDRLDDEREGSDAAQDERKAEGGVDSKGKGRMREWRP
jgi:hypothetical protein